MIKNTLNQVLLILLLSFLIGSASSIFLFGLDFVQTIRPNLSSLWLLLPLIAILFQWIKKPLPDLHHTGTNQFIEQVQEQEKKTSPFFSVYILVSTWLSHLAGASVGREGTAVQMGASISEQLSTIFPKSPEQKSIWLRAGMAAGFASVFGTPLAGTLFGLEISTVGKISYKSFFPCLLTSFGANWVSLHVYHTKHTIYPAVFLPELNLAFWLNLSILAAFLSLLAYVYKALESNIFYLSEQLPKHFILKGIISGLLIYGLLNLPGFHTSVGLSADQLLVPFQKNISSHFFIQKLTATAASLGLGFKGGEATPLFLIGSHGAAFLSNFISMPSTLAAAVGFVALYCGLAKTPFTGMLLGMELFSNEAWFIYLLVTIFVMFFSGKNGLFKQQKWADNLPKPLY